MEDDIENIPIYSFIKEMPKVELHAHLNGSLSQDTMKKLIEMKKPDEKGDLCLPSSTMSNLSECFQQFDLIYKLTDTPEAMYMATCDVIKEFYSDGVRYLELRTTPREEGSFRTQTNFVETALKAIEDTLYQDLGDMSVKLLLSINRAKSVEIAYDTLKIAERFCTSSSSTVVGIDFSGNPKKGNIHDFVPVLQKAKQVGLQLALHIAEIADNSDEVEHLLNLHPDRIGHGTFLHPSKNGSMENFELLKKLNIPLEICLTSNVVSKTVSSYEDHHFPLFKEINHPCILCTDDKGIFNTTLSKEYYLASKYFSLSRDDLLSLSFDSINYIFSKNEIPTLRQYLNLYTKAL